MEIIWRWGRFWVVWGRMSLTMWYGMYTHGAVAGQSIVLLRIVSTALWELVNSSMGTGMGNTGIDFNATGMAEWEGVMYDYD